ncbi:methyl-accepting chemotaxis protein [Leptospira sp. 'Mane']|uniref:HAMP domain-containing methyl-accepting chemotaxis protein n=1 Tax=Leptospira sp. 'Mane' TaxID=3387407 RepID=UPI00398AA6CF
MKWFGNLKIRTRMLIGFFTTLILMILIGSISLWTTQKVLHSLETVYADRVVPISQLKDISDSYLIGIVDVAHKVRSGRMKYEDGLKSIARSEEKATKVWSEYMLTYLVPEEKSIIAKMEPELPLLKEGVRKLESILRSQNQSDLDKFTSEEMYPKFEPYTNHIDDLIRVQLIIAEREYQKSEQEYEESIFFFFTVLGLAIGAIILISFFLSAAIANPMKEIVKVAKQISDGDLNVQLSDKLLLSDSQLLNQSKNNEIKVLAYAFSELVEFIKERAKILESISMSDLTMDVTLKSEKDVLGKSLKLMVSNLSEIIEKLHFSSQEVDLGAQQLTDASTSLSGAASEQASAVEEISATLTEIGNSFVLNAENAERMTQLSQVTTLQAGEGNAKMADLVIAMQEISSSFEQISKINKVINDIAFQTNILALNAAVEAARAGQHGKGFAVVADEVRNLAQKSANAADETTTLIETSLKKVRLGSLATDKTAEVLAKISESAKNVNQLTSDLSISINEQKSAVMQITQGVDQVTTVTSTTAASAEEVAASSETLKRQVEIMRSVILGFQLKAHTSTALARIDRGKIIL